MPSWHENQYNVQIFTFQTFYRTSTKIYATKVLLPFEYELFGGEAMLATSCPTKNGKRLTYDAIDTCATRAGLFHDVTGRGCRKPNGKVHGRVFSTFEPPLLTTPIMSKVKNCCEHVLLYSLSIDR